MDSSVRYASSSKQIPRTADPGSCEPMNDAEAVSPEAVTIFEPHFKRKFIHS